MNTISTMEGIGGMHIRNSRFFKEEKMRIVIRFEKKKDGFLIYSF
jgi:hypothetical protein